MLRFAHIPIGDGEGVTCARCSRSADDSFFSVERIAHEIAHTASVWREAGGVNVALIGPEPFKHPALPQVVASAVEHGCDRVRLRTDGGALSVAHNAAGVLHAGVHQIEVVVLGPDSSSHDRLSGTDGLFEAARSGVRAYIAAGEAAGAPIAVTALVRLCKHNATLLPAIVAQTAQWGVSCIAVERAQGVAVPASTAAAALQTAVMSSVWLTGATDQAAGVAPWDVWEGER